MRITVIGGTRFIGAAVVERLIAGGHEVTVFHRGETEVADDHAADARHVHGNRAAIAEYAGALTTPRPDVVLDMAAMTEIDATRVLDLFRGVAPRIVAISSVDVYRAYGRLHGSEPGPIEPMPLTEDSALREALYPYRGQRGGRMDDYDKIPVERAVMSTAGITGTVLRLPAVHGERDYQHRLFMEVARMDAGRPAILVQDDAIGWRWPRAYVGNVADAIVLAVTDGRAAGRVYNVCELPAPTQEEWLRTVARIARWDGEIVALPPDQLPEHLRSPNNHAQSMVVDSTRIRTELGFREAVSWEEGIARAITWGREHPPERGERWLDYAAEDAALARSGRA